MIKKLTLYMERIIAKEYLLDSYKFSTTASIVDLIQVASDIKIKLSNTIFHPQGGGQPNDIGSITQGPIIFDVKSAETDKTDSNVWHVGKFTSGSEFDRNAEVTVLIDEAKRRLHARLHSGGHLLDIAVQRLGYPLVPGKGYHFAEGSYVEYVGNIQDKDRAVLDINEECKKIINEAVDSVSAIILSYEEAQKAFTVPSYLAGESSIRYVKLTPQDNGCPCGGTHVKTVHDIGSVVVTKIQKKGKNLRVSYKVE